MELLGIIFGTVLLVVINLILDIVSLGQMLIFIGFIGVLWVIGLSLIVNPQNLFHIHISFKNRLQNTVKIGIFVFALLMNTLVPQESKQTLVSWTNLTFFHYINVFLWLISTLIFGGELLQFLLLKRKNSLGSKYLALILAPLLSFFVDFILYIIFDYFAVQIQAYSIFKGVAISKTLIFGGFFYVNQKTLKRKQTSLININFQEIGIVFFLFCITIGSHIILSYNLKGDAWRILQGLQKFLRNDYQLYYPTPLSGVYPIFWPAIVYINSLYFQIGLINTSVILNLFFPLLFFAFVQLLLEIKLKVKEKYIFFIALGVFTIGNWTFWLSMVGLENVPYIYHFQNLIVNFLHNYNNVIIYFSTILCEIILLFKIKNQNLIEREQILKISRLLAILPIIGLLIHEVELLVFFLILIPFMVVFLEDINVIWQYLEHVIMNFLIIVSSIDIFLQHRLFGRFLFLIFPNYTNLINSAFFKTSLTMLPIFLIIIQIGYNKIISPKLKFSNKRHHKIRNKIRNLANFGLNNLILGIMLGFIGISFSIFISGQVKQDYSIWAIMPSFGVWAFLYGYGLFIEKNKRMRWVSISIVILLIVFGYFLDYFLFLKTRVWVYTIILVFIHGIKGIKNLIVKIIQWKLYLKNTDNSIKTKLSIKWLVSGLIIIIVIIPGFVSNYSAFQEKINDDYDYIFKDENLIEVMDYIENFLSQSEKILTNYYNETPYEYLTRNELVSIKSLINQVKPSMILEYIISQNLYYALIQKKERMNILAANLFNLQHTILFQKGNLSLIEFKESVFRYDENILTYNCKTSYGEHQFLSEDQLNYVDETSHIEFRLVDNSSQYQTEKRFILEESKQNLQLNLSFQLEKANNNCSIRLQSADQYGILLYVKNGTLEFFDTNLIKNKTVINFLPENKFYLGIEYNLDLDSYFLRLNNQSLGSFRFYQDLNEINLIKFITGVKSQNNQVSVEINEIESLS